MLSCSDIYVMHSDRTGNKSHMPLLRYEESKLAYGWKITHLSILRSKGFFFRFVFVFVFFLNTMICFLSPLHYFWLNFKYFPSQKILHFLQSVKSKIIGIGNFKGQFLKIALPEKLLTVLYTNGHISKSVKSMNLTLVSN